MSVIDYVFFWTVAFVAHSVLLCVIGARIVRAIEGTKR